MTQAAAEAKKKVDITTTPPGAQVYLNLKEDGPVCTTPCTVSVPVGATPIIIELENYQSLLEELSVEKKEKTPKRAYTLEPAVGVILVKGPRGAVIKVNDAEWSSTAPARIEIQPGDHVVILEVNGKEVFSEAVSVENGGEVSLEGPRGGGGGDDQETPGGLDGLGVGPDVVDTVPPPKAPRTLPIVTVQLVMDVGFRSFEYDQPGMGLAPEKESGQVLVGPLVEFYPGTLLGMKPLRGLALLGRYGHGLNSQPVIDANGDTLGASTYWRTIELSLRQRWAIGRTATVEVSGGYVRDLYRFEGNVAEIINLPDAEYGALRIGARLGLRLGSLEPYLAAENRIVLDGGPLADRFNNPSANGIRGALGAAMRFGAVDVRLEGSLARYTWTFGPGGMFEASGATDQITKLTAAIAYTY